MDGKNNSSNERITVHNIKSNIMLKKIFEKLQHPILLQIICYNKKLQQKLKKDINDYKEYLKTEIEIIPKQTLLLKFINTKSNRCFYQIYYDDDTIIESKTNKIRIEKGQTVSKIKVIIDYEFKKFSELFNSCINIIKIKFIKFNRRDIKNMDYMFSECSSLKELDLSNFHTGRVTDMTSMFNKCSSLKELDLSKFNTNNVTSMYDMFGECYSLEKINISSFNTDKVKDMAFMFNNCSYRFLINESEQLNFFNNLQS